MEENKILSHIRELCKQKNWSLYQLGKNSGITYSTINNLFTRNNVPTLETLQKICDGLQITMSEFFAVKTLTTKELTPKQLELIERWNALSPTDKNLLDAYLTGLEKKI
jgi:Predicted transcriptional regulators